VFFLNGLVAFALNLSVALVIKKASALAYVFTGIFKDVMIVTTSALTGGSVTRLQVVGYGIAMVGIQTHNAYKRNTKEYEQRGVLKGD
jgi:hypothetical protein